MSTDDERREVARKLRFGAGTAFHMNTCDDFAREVFRAAMDEGIGDYRAAINRLADLIDPGSGHVAQAVACEVDAVTCDREALLELADEMQKNADWCDSLSGKSIVWANILRGYSDRIHEALGVER